MKLKRTAAITLAALTAVSAVSVCAFAEETKNEPAKLLASELTADLKTNMVFVEGIGVVDITGADFDSSENVGADENANLDVDFDGIAYLSKDNLKTWKETGVLTLSKLKADFDTTGLKWGMFNAKNGYVQLVKIEKQTVEEWGEKVEKNVVTYRGLYKIENNEIKKLCDLSPFWTYTRADGVSVGFESTLKTATITFTDPIDPSDAYTDTYTDWTELKMITTQPDGTRKETVIETRDNETVFGNNIIKIADAGVVDFGPGMMVSVPSVGDTLACVGFTTGSGGELYPMMPNNTYHTVYEIYGDGTIKKICKDGERSINQLSSLGSDYVMWTAIHHRFGSAPAIYFYNNKTGKIESAGDGDEPFDEMLLDNCRVEQYIELEDNYITQITSRPSLYDDRDKNGYIIVNGLKDLYNWESKTYYDYIRAYGFDNGDSEQVVYHFITKDGKIGYMDGNEKVLAEFDATDGFAGDFAPVVKGGKAYLIDKNMNAVSTEIAADDVVAIDEDLFIAKNGDKTYFVTYAGDIKVTTGGKAPATETVVVDYSDNGVTASAEKGVIANGAALSVKAVEDKTDDKNVTYEISFKNGDKEVQPKGKVTVKIPVPDAFKDKTIYVYRVEGEKYVDMEAKVKDGYVVFETSHFSEYVITTEKRDNAVLEYDNPKTGADSIALTMGLIALAGAAVAVYRKKK